MGFCFESVRFIIELACLQFVTIEFGNIRQIRSAVFCINAVDLIIIFKENIKERVLNIIIIRVF